MELNVMVRTTRAIFLIIMIILFSCEEKGLLLDCDDCTANEPIDAVVKAEVDLYSLTGVVVKVWEGKLEDNLLIDSVKIYRSSYERKVAINKTYTITATYIINNKEYTAVDSATPRVRYTADNCEEPCYYVYDQWYELRLKYTK